jgi:tRNA(adenine34) deaminase
MASRKRLMDDQYYMELALQAAREAATADEAPVGAVIVCGGEVIAVERNRREERQDPTAHAELLAIVAAAKRRNNWRLEQCTLFVTLEPCPMCAGAIVQARLPRVVYGARDAKGGAVRSLFQLLDDSRLNHQVEVCEGLLAEPCGAILSQFFQGKRRRKAPPDLPGV